MSSFRNRRRPGWGHRSARKVAVAATVALAAALAGPPPGRGTDTSHLGTEVFANRGESVRAQRPPPEMELRPLPVPVPQSAGNPGTPAKVALGRLLFFDPILSSSGDTACATCHHPRWGWADGRATPLGTGGRGLGPQRTWMGTGEALRLERNTLGLLNVGYTGLTAGGLMDPNQAPLFWDARIQGLERQVAAPISTAGELCGSDCGGTAAVDHAVRRVAAVAEYRQLFGAAFGSPPETSVDAKHLMQAIASFERSLITGPTRFDRSQSGDVRSLTAGERRGLEAFERSGCRHCHGGPMFSDFKLHVVGVVGAGEGAGERRAWRTPTLRQLRQTAPYFHDGSRRTLREVLQFYEELAEAVSETVDGGDHSVQPPLDPLLRHLRLDPDEFPALEAFLLALSSEEYDRSTPTRVPSGLAVPEDGK